MSEQIERRRGGIRPGTPEPADNNGAAMRHPVTPPFRRAIAAMAERVRPRHAAPRHDVWEEIRKQLSELPQMSSADHPSNLPASAGRRRIDAVPRSVARWAGIAGRLPAIGSGRLGAPVAMLGAWFPAPVRHDWFVAAALIAFFVLGYAAALAIAPSTVML